MNEILIFKDGSEVLRLGRGKYPFEEKLECMMKLIRQGKIRRWRVSNTNVAEMEEFYHLTNGDTCAANEML